MDVGTASEAGRLNDMLGLRNPIILGSGPLGSNARGLLKQSRHAGAVVGKSITFLPREGNPHPRIVSLGDLGLINWENLPNMGYERFSEELRTAREQCECPIIASVGPSSNLAQLKTIALAFEEAGADALELDFKWGFDTTTGRTGYDLTTEAQGFQRDSILEIVSTLKNTVSIPLIAKLVAFAGDIVDSALAAEEAGADAVTAINSVFPAMKIDVRKQSPALSSHFGGLSGKSILPIAVGCVYRIYEAISIPIIGCGGVSSGEDALEMVMAGADAVQICTVAMLEGSTAFKRINDELSALVDELGFVSVESCLGLAHR